MFLILSENFSRRKVSASESMIDLLKIISPKKSACWEKSNRNRLTIDAKDFLWPLVPDEALLKQLWPAPEKILSVLQPRFDSIELLGGSESWRVPEEISNVPASRYSPGETTRISLIEAKQLAECIEGAAFTEERCFAVKIEDHRLDLPARAHPGSFHHAAGLDRRAGGDGRPADDR